MKGFIKLKNSILIICIFIIHVVSQNLYAQDLSNIKNEKLITVNGGLNLSNDFYKCIEGDNRNEPYVWLANANLNFNILGISVPFSASFSNYNKNYTHPFNQYGLSPKYKNLTLHGGYRSMQFSNYTLSGLVFLGGGAEYEFSGKPKFKLSTFYGRFSKAVKISNSNAYLMTNSMFERWGSGGKLSLNINKNNYDLIVFKVWDKINSLNINDSVMLKPKENLGLGINANQYLTKNLTIKVEYALSLMTNDRLAQINQEIIKNKIYNSIDKFYKLKQSTVLSSVIVTQATLNIFKSNVGIVFRQIDPNYQSLGTPFLTNDIREYLFNLSRGFAKNRLNFSGNVGYQFNNLNNKNNKDSKRIVGNTNFNIVFSNSLNASIGFSNSNYISTPSIVAVGDSVKIFQVNKSGNFNITYMFGGEKEKHNISFSGNINQANDNYESAGSSQKSKMMFYNANVMHSLNFVPLKFNVSTSLNFSENNAKDMNSRFIGPSLSINKTFDKNITLSTSWNNSYMFSNEKLNSISNTISLSATKQIKKIHSISLASSYIQRNSKNMEIEKNIKEIRANVSYRINI